jgi:dephospho-CoA kinase
MRRVMLTIGLTGGIGSGKSTVASILAELGALVWDADVIGHSVYEPGMPAHNELLAAFGSAILGPDGTIDRKALGRIVFADATALKRLNAIVHPRIFERIAAMVREARAAGERRLIVIEAAILIESGWQKLFDEIWLVVTSRERVIERVEHNRKLTREQIEARIRAQLSEDERLKWANVVIHNDGTLDELRSSTATVFADALARAAVAARRE